MSDSQNCLTDCFDAGTFHSRASFSVGVVPALQSFACNVRNDCHDPDGFEDVPSYHNAKLWRFARHAGPVFDDPHLYDGVRFAPNILKLINGTVEVFNQTRTVKFIGKSYSLKSGIKEFAPQKTNPDLETFSVVRKG